MEYKLETPLNSLVLTEAETAIIDSLDEKRDELINTMMSWSAQNSGSRNRAGLNKMRALLLGYFQTLPGEIIEEGLATGSYVQPDGVETEIDYVPALRISVREDAPIQIVLTGHYDTVFPEDSHFQTPVYVDDDTVNGPGTADMKAGILVMAAALMAFEQFDKAKNIGYQILLSPDEEIGSPGSAPILARLGKKAHVGLTYEPALEDGSMAGARKGSGNFAVVVRGKAAHAGREHHIGRNAIAALSEFVVKLDALNGQRDGVTFNIAKIDGGGAPNIVPELAIGRYNVRLKELDDMDWITDRVTELVAELNRKDGISAELTGGFTRPPKPMAPANAQVFEWVRQAGAMLGQEIRWSPSGGVCEGNNLWASGCPNVDTLGVRGGNIHSDKEFVKLSSLVERAKLSTVILMKLASGEFDARAVKDMAMRSL